MKSNVLGGFVLVTAVFLGGSSLVLYGFPRSSSAEVVLVEPSAPATVSPSVTTGDASDIAPGGTATFHGAILPNDTTTTYWFEYSSDPLMGAILNRKTSHVSVMTSKTKISVFADVANLSSHTTYYFRIVAENSAGRVRGDRMSFNTI